MDTDQCLDVDKTGVLYCTLASLSVLFPLQQLLNPAATCLSNDSYCLLPFNSLSAKTPLQVVMVHAIAIQSIDFFCQE